MTNSETGPEGARPVGGGYWFTPLPVYLLDAVYSPDSPVNAPAAMLWAHIHRHYAWRERVFPSYARLAQETGQSESAVRRQLNALKAAGAITWGATYSARGRSSNSYALAAVEPFRFDRDATAVEFKSDPHPAVQVKNDPGVQSKNDRHPQVKNDLGIKSTKRSKNTLSPVVDEPSPATHEERETRAPRNNHNPTPADQVAAAWAAARGGHRNPAAEERLRMTAGPLLTSGWPLAEVKALAVDMAHRYPTWTDLGRHAMHQTPPTPTPAGTPQAATVPHCGDPDCSPIDRMRAVERDGREVLTRCPECHPQRTVA